jgi:anti-sigma B factor antagonist
MSHLGASWVVMSPVRQIEVTTEELGPDARRMVVVGELDLVTAGDVVDGLRRALRDAGRVVIDLTGVQFVDSTGLAALMRCRRMASAREATLEVVVEPGGPVEQVARITRISAVLGLTYA